MVTLNSRDSRPIYVQIVDGIREQIALGILAPGEKLPSVRELAGVLAINPNTIQRAYRELEAGGWVTSEAGRGCFVRQAPENAGRKDALVRSLQETAGELRRLGLTEEDLIRLITKGGTNHA